MIIGIDFDGTCVTQDFPAIGKDIGAVPVLMWLIECGHKLVLTTMRSDSMIVNTKNPDIYNKAGDYLTQSVKWFENHGIELYGINENPTQKEWTQSPKPYCHLYIDDTALGCPVKFNPKLSDKYFVDWERVQELLLKQGILEWK
jgi:hypothetical protein